MKTHVLVAAALTLATTVSIAVGAAQAASAARNPMCNMQPSSASWQEYYGCWGGGAAKPAPAVARVQPASSKTEYCHMQPNSASWQEYYGCWGRK
ncbi:MAG TPA: hypothetical protein VGJ20_24430 [Xanthobacteraceae bacterium]|jgi:hypothetical protein